jgi:1,2-dihydroxy-3-keto-5-methylthiopentene dioxygenase
MAIVTRLDDGTVYEDPIRIGEFLARFGIWYRRFEDVDRLGDEASEADVLEAFAEPIRALSAEGGYVTADVIDVKADTPNLAAMLDRFNKEHTHDEDEVRFIVAGRGIFHVHPEGGPVFRIEVHAGDLINVPRGTRHWFDLCSESRIRAVRLFQDRAGWTPHYTGSGEDAKHQPLCFGPRYLPFGARSV